MEFFDGAAELDERSTAEGWTIRLHLRDASAQTFSGPPGAPVDDFAFLTGPRRVRHRRRTDPLTAGSPWAQFDGTHVGHLLCGGAVSVDEAELPDGVRGLTLRTYDRDHGRWSIHWVNSRRGRLEPPVHGAFGADGTGTFDGVEELDGRTVHVRFRWTDITATHARWRQWFSFDGGTSWEHNWEMVFTR